MYSQSQSVDTAVDFTFLSGKVSQYVTCQCQSVDTFENLCQSKKCLSVVLSRGNADQ